MGWKAATRSRDDPAKRKVKRVAKREALKRGAVPAPKEKPMSGNQADHASSPRKRRHARDGARKLGMD